MVHLLIKKRTIYGTLITIRRKTLHSFIFGALQFPAGVRFSVITIHFKKRHVTFTERASVSVLSKIYQLYQNVLKISFYVLYDM